MQRFADTQGKESSPSATYTCDSASVRRLKKSRPVHDSGVMDAPMTDRAHGRKE
jgi:hypothetical protein